MNIQILKKSLIRTPGSAVRKEMDLIRSVEGEGMAGGGRGRREGGL